MKILASALGLLACILGGCGGGGSGSPGPPPDMTGQWIGTFTPDDGGTAETFYLVIVDQSGEDFSGTWDSNTISSTGQVTGFVYPGNDSRWLADLEMKQGQTITCCTPLLGCYDWPYRQIFVFGYLDDDNGVKSITDEAAMQSYGCLSAYGTMTLTRQ